MGLMYAPSLARLPGLQAALAQSVLGYRDFPGSPHMAAVSKLGFEPGTPVGYQDALFPLRDGDVDDVLAQLSAVFERVAADAAAQDGDMICYDGAEVNGFRVRVGLLLQHATAMFTMVSASLTAGGSAPFQVAGESVILDQWFRLLVAGGVACVEAQVYNLLAVLCLGKPSYAAKFLGEGWGVNRLLFAYQLDWFTRLVLAVAGEDFGAVDDQMLGSVRLVDAVTNA